MKANVGTKKKKTQTEAHLPFCDSDPVFETIFYYPKTICWIRQISFDPVSPV